MNRDESLAFFVYAIGGDALYEPLTECLMWWRRYCHTIRRTGVNPINKILFEAYHDIEQGDSYGIYDQRIIRYCSTHLEEFAL